MKTYRISIWEREYRVTIVQFENEFLGFCVQSIEPEFTLYDPCFRIDKKNKQIHFHQSEFHKAVWQEIQKDINVAEFI